MRDEVKSTNSLPRPPAFECLLLFFSCGILGKSLNLAAPLFSFPEGDTTSHVGHWEAWNQYTCTGDQRLEHKHLHRWALCHGDMEANQLAPWPCGVHII